MQHHLSFKMVLVLLLRVWSKGLLRGGKEKRDENGNVITDKDGKPQRELNWKLAQKNSYVR